MSEILEEHLEVFFQLRILEFDRMILVQLLDATHFQ